MKRINLSVAIISLIMSVIISCSDILEPDITNDLVELRAPSDSLVTFDKNIRLWWNSLKGASQYRLMVVTPDVNNPDIISLDTLLTTTNFQAQLTKGKYQWCVQGINSAYKTDTSCRSIEILE